MIEALPAGSVVVGGVDAHAGAGDAGLVEGDAGAERPTSMNVPSPRLRYSRFGCVSLATKRSRRPSSS